MFYRKFFIPYTTFTTNLILVKIRIPSSDLLSKNNNTIRADTPRSVESNPIWEDNNSAKTRPTPLCPIPIQKATSNLRNVTSSHTKAYCLPRRPLLLTLITFRDRSVYRNSRARTWTFVPSLLDTWNNTFL